MSDSGDACGIDPVAELTDEKWLTAGVRGIGVARLIADLGHEVPTALLPSFMTHRRRTDRRAGGDRRQSWSMPVDDAASAPWWETVRRVEVIRWPDLPARRARGRSVAVVSVSHNTRELIALLFYSLWAVLDWQELSDVIVVDNGSTDGSRELLASVAEDGSCTILANDENVYHGPALNQAMSYLAARAHGSGSAPDWVWILDSDCVITRPCVLARSLEVAVATSAALVGELAWDRWHRVDRLGVHCLLLDPARVWREPVAAFSAGGDPSFELLSSARSAGLREQTFPFLAERYVVHLGRGTLAGVAAANDTTNRFYDWAVDHHEPHFGNVSGAAALHEALVSRFHAAVGDVTSDKSICDCVRRCGEMRARAAPIED